MSRSITWTWIKNPVFTEDSRAWGRWFFPRQMEDLPLHGFRTLSLGSKISFSQLWSVVGLLNWPFRQYMMQWEGVVRGESCYMEENILCSCMIWWRRYFYIHITAVEFVLSNSSAGTLQYKYRYLLQRHHSVEKAKSKRLKYYLTAQKTRQHRKPLFADCGRLYSKWFVYLGKSLANTQCLGLHLSLTYMWPPSLVVEKIWNHR